MYAEAFLYICHPHTDCLFVSQIFSMAKHTGRFKLWSKPTYLYARFGIQPLSLFSSAQELLRILLAFVCLYFSLSATRGLNSSEELYIMWVAAVSSFARVLNPSFVVSQLFNVAKKRDILWIHKPGIRTQKHMLKSVRNLTTP